MLWVIVLVVLGGIGLVGYYLYLHPPLSQAGKQQRANYLQKLGYAKTLIYQISPSHLAHLMTLLKQAYLSAGNGCYYGTGIMIYLKVDVEPSQASFHLFGRSPDLLTRTTWRLTQLKRQSAGGLPTASP